MKKILFLALSASMLCLSAAAQENVYMIDGKNVENFDGSQLVGKEIKHYDLKRLPQVIIHNIFTTDDWEKIEGVDVKTNAYVLTKEEAKSLGLPLTSGTMKATMRNPLLIVDGQEFKGKLNDILDDMAYVDVYKPEDEVAKSYGEKGKNGVMKIFTKKMSDAKTFFIDGKPASKADFNVLSPNGIKKIKVLMRGTAQAKEASSEGETNDIYQITTK